MKQSECKKTKFSYIMEKLLKEKNIDQKQLAGAIGERTENISNVLCGKSKTISRRLAESITSVYPDINYMWLTTGVEPMHITENITDIHKILSPHAVPSRKTDEDKKLTSFLASELERYHQREDEYRQREDDARRREHEYLRTIQELKDRISDLEAGNSYIKSQMPYIGFPGTATGMAEASTQDNIKN